MKKIVSITALLLMSSAALFASGNKDAEDTDTYGRGPAGGRGGMGRAFDDDRGSFPGRAPEGYCYDENGELVELEEISVDGNLVLEDGTMPYLNTSEGKVFLMVPPFVIYDLELKGGEAVSVTGYDTASFGSAGPGMMSWGDDSDATYLRVSSAVIDGEEYDLGAGSWGGPGMGGRAPRGGSSRGGTGRGGYCL